MIFKKKLPIKSKEREDVLVSLLERLDSLIDANAKAIEFGRLQAEAEEIKPPSQDTQIVIEIISQSRKEAKKEGK